MRPTTLLKQDHQVVKELFAELQQAGEDAPATRKRIFDTIRRELEAHMQVEEEIFYPTVEKSHTRAEKKMVLEACEEHAIVKQLLGQIAMLEASDVRFDAKLKVLEDMVLHHVKEEEKTIHKYVDSELSGEELDRLGLALEARKDELLATEPEAPAPEASAPRDAEAQMAAPDAG